MLHAEISDPFWTLSPHILRILKLFDISVIKNCADCGHYPKMRALESTDHDLSNAGSTACVRRIVQNMWRAENYFSPQFLLIFCIFSANLGKNAKDVQKLR